MEGYAQPYGKTTHADGHEAVGHGWELNSGMVCSVCTRVSPGICPLSRCAGREEGVGGAAAGLAAGVQDPETHHGQRGTELPHGRAAAEPRLPVLPSPGCL